MNDFRSDDEDMAISKLINKAGPLAQPSAEREARVRAAVHEHWQSGGQTQRTTPPLAWLAGIAAALVLTIGVFTLREPSQTAPVLMAEILSQRGAVNIADVDGAMFAGTVVRTGADGMLNLRLASGHELRVHSDTEVEITAIAHLELTAGTVYLDSGANQAHASLQVTTPYGSARDVGTQFEVRVDTDGLEVAVREGLVALDALPDAVAISDKTIERGSGVRVSAAGGATRFAVAPWGERWAWASSMSRFGKDKAPGHEYLEWLVREYGLTLRVDNASVTQILAEDLSGFALSITGDPDSELEDALLPLQLKHRMEAGGVVVVFAAESE